MRFIDFRDFYYTVCGELNEAERSEGFLIQMYPGLPITRGENVMGAIGHLREAWRDLRILGSCYMKRLDEQEARYRRLEDRDREYYRDSLMDFGADLRTASSLLEHARQQYLFFGGKSEVGYPYEELINETLFRMELTAVRLQNTKAFPLLRLNIGIVKDDLEEILERDKKFRDAVALN